MASMSQEFREWYEEETGWDIEEAPNHDVTEILWLAWQASRAAVEIEIPEVLDYWLGREGFAESIRAAGLKVKGE